MQGKGIYYSWSMFRDIFILYFYKKNLYFLIHVSPLLCIFSLTENIEKYFQQQFQEV